MDQAQEIIETANWINDFVLKHNLCPFAHKPVNENTVKYVLTNEEIGPDLVEKFLLELDQLKAKPSVSTCFLVCPKLNKDFLTYINFIYELEDVLIEKEFEEDFQLASFHPDYQFAGTLAEDVTNMTNRSPHALIHILRADEMEEAIEQYGDTDQIPINNMEKMKKLFAE